MKLRLLLLSLIPLSLWAMEPAPHTVDANGYHYTDERDIQDRRAIAILAYGSLVNQPINPRNNVQLIANPFIETDLNFPIALSRRSQGDRITAVIDNQLGEPRQVWASLSGFSYLPNARHNLAAREGTPLRSAHTGYDLSNIFYMKKLLHGKPKDSNEEIVPGMPQWVIRATENPRQKLLVPTVQAVAQWADLNGFDAIIWASFSPTFNSNAEIMQALLDHDELLYNTQEYTLLLPNGPQTELERIMVNGKDAVRSHLASHPASHVSPAQSIASPDAPLSADRELQYQNYVHYQRGNLPILLTAPHGGSAHPEGVSTRTGRNFATGRPLRNQFNKVSDDGTLEITQQVSDNIYRLTGLRPYVVAADFHRMYIDANRAGNEAYENEHAKSIYNFYHNKIREYITDLKQRFGDKILLLDIHGQGTDARTVFRGTCDRQTVQRLLQREGQAAFTGPHSVLGSLQRLGNTIYPRNNDSNTDEKGIYSGGYTVGTYGSHNRDGIDAIQLENGWALRNSERAQFSENLARAIVDFCEHYLH